MEARYGHHDDHNSNNGDDCGALSPEIVEIFPRGLREEGGSVASVVDDEGEEGSLYVGEGLGGGSAVEPSSSLALGKGRGRKDVRVGSKRRERRGRRPRTVARAPSGELWTVVEEREGEEVGLGLGIVVEGVDGR